MLHKSYSRPHPSPGLSADEIARMQVISECRKQAIIHYLGVSESNGMQRMYMAFIPSEQNNEF